MEERKDQINNRIKMQGSIIRKAVIVENLLNEILFVYFQPKNELVFITHVLNSSVMHYGGKLKVLHGIIDKTEILKIDKKKFEGLRRLSSIRNSFAHTNIEDKYDVLFDDIDLDDNPFWTISDSIEIMNSAGKVEDKEPQEFYDEFNKLFESSLHYLKDLKDLKTTIMNLKV